MTIRFQIGYPLETLPNLEGFRFRGVEENADLTPCKVIRHADGLHQAISEVDGLPVFYRLRGWMQYLPSTKKETV